MDIEKFSDSPAGQLVPIKGTDPRLGTTYDHFAFVPAPLPRPVDLGRSAWNAASQAMEGLGKLWQACFQLPNPRLLIAPALTKEAVATSALEGTYGTVSEVMEARLPQFATPRRNEVREIRAYETMAELAFSWVRDRPITIGMLCQLQKVLADGSAKPTKDPGQVRNHQVIIGPEDCPIPDARYIPPPPGDQLRAGLEEWLQWTTEDHEVPVVVRAALAHYQFEALHPFGDGNGRIGRLLIVLHMLLAGAIPEPALTISPWLLRRREEYQSHLLAVSQTWRWDPWIEFFCMAVKEQAEAHVRVARELMTWLGIVRDQLHQRRWGGVIVRVAEDLVAWPVVTMAWVADRYETSAPTAKHAVDRLVEIGALSEMTGRTYNRAFGATEVIRLVESL